MGNRSSNTAGNGRGLSKNARNNLLGYFFIGPWLIMFLAFTVVPFFASLVLSFCDYNMLSAPTFVGWDNYVKLFTEDRLFTKSLLITLKFVFISIPLRLIFALIVAMILNRDSKMVPIYRVVYYLPSILGGSVAVSVLWRYVFAKEGVFNQFLNLIGIPCNISWISNKDTALWCIILLFIWQFGSPMLIFLAGLKQIPKTYYEAASIDGAGKVVTFFRITLPLLSPIFFFNLVMQMIGGFMVFSQAMIITDGGPLNNTMVYALYLYKQAFGYYKMGYGCAMAWILMIIIGFFTLLVFKSSSAWVFYENQISEGNGKKKRKRGGKKA
jgi:multiple sugar transport system permease protein